MDFRTASNIYRKPWLIEGQSALRCLQLLDEAKNGKAPFAWKDDEEDDNREGVFQKLFANADVVTAPIDTYEAKRHQGYEGKTVGILPVIGPMMKEDFCGWFGTASLRNELAKMNATESIKCIIMLMDSPGGTVDGTEALANAYAASSKDTITVIDGMMCSAGYWAGSPAQKIVATNMTDMIGSIGTMISFYDYTQAREEMGIVLREYYATKSKDKNKDFREARDGDGKLIIETLLNPLNDVFLDAVRAYRGDKLNEKETLSGKVFLSQKALELGLIDEISTMDQVINSTINKYKSNSLIMSTKNSWQKFKAFLGIGSEDKIEMKDEHFDKVEALVAENETLKATITDLQANSQTNQDRVTELQSQLSAVTTERDGLQSKVTTLEEKVVELGSLDGTKFTTTAAQAEKKDEDAVEMSASQKALTEKANSL